jgi:hypothetical protein
MKKVLILASVIAFSFGCSKKTSEEPKPVTVSNASSKIQLRMEESTETSSATGSTYTDAGGSVFVKLNFRPGILAPNVTYNSYVLKPVVSFPTYAEIGGASSGISGDCFANLQGIYTEAINAVSKVSMSAASGNADFSSYCDLISELRKGASSCPQASQLGKVADALCLSLTSLKGVPGVTGADCASCK